MRYLSDLVLIAVMVSCSIPDAPLAQVATPSPAPAVSATAVPTPAVPEPSAVATVDVMAQPTALVAETFAAAGDGLLLRDLLPQQASLAAAPLTLIYSEVVPNPDGSSRTNAFWAINMGQISQRQKLTDISTQWRLDGALYARLSPDGNYIAHLDPTMEDADLYVVQRDGSGHRRVARGLTSTARYERDTFAWAPSGLLLAYMRHWEQGQSFFVYDAATGGEPREVARVGGAAFGGWLDDKHVLTYVVTDQQQPLQLTSIDVVTRAQESLGQFPRDGIFYSQFASDRRTIWMADYLFDVTARRFTPIDPVGGPFVWAGSQHLLKVPQRNGETAHVIALAQPAQSTPIAFLPPFEVTEGFTLQGASPDGRYIIGCGGYDDTATGRTVYRSLLYNVSANQWHILTEGSYCGNVVGWSAS